jgi:hypothetical protein
MREIPQASTINRAAGSHPITDDPRELEAARRAAERSVREYPYYQARYGESAMRFGHSDGAWIALLAHDIQRGVNEQVLWLGNVLACRGMPRLLLERHLEILHEELAAAVPEERPRYEKLQRAAEMLRAQRRAVLGDDDMHALAAELDASVSGEGSTPIPRLGEVVVAAAVDERLGIHEAAASVERWITVPERFPPGWTDAVHRTLEAARDRMSALRAR